MRRGTVVVIVFVLIAAAIVGASQFLRSQPPLELSVAVNPLIADWVQNAVTRYNATQPVVAATQRIQFNVTVVDDFAVWQGNQTWVAQNHPAAWIPASSASVGYTSTYAVSTPSVAQTLLVWGGYQSRVDVAAGDEALDWTTVQALAAQESWANLPGGQRNWGFVQLGFPRPDQTMSGLAALFSSAAAFNNSSDITGNATRSTEFREWLTPVIQSVNFQNLGANPAATVARGASTIQIALLPESQWLLNLNGLTDDEAFVFSYPEYAYVLDFPLASWRTAAEVTSAEREAVTALSEWLLADAQQNRLHEQGLRLASGEIDANAELFASGESFGIQLQPDISKVIIPPGRNEAQGLVQWFITAQRR